MARRATRPFRYQIAKGEFVPYAKGAVIAPEHENHWFVLENSESFDDPAVAAPAAAPLDLSPAEDVASRDAETEEELADDARREAAGEDKDALISLARERGIAVNSRMSIERIKAVIGAAAAR